MKTLLLQTFLVLVLTGLGISPASPENTPYKTYIVGADAPDAIPIWAKLDELVNNYSGELEGKLKGYDKATFYRLMREAEWTRGIVRVLKMVRTHHYICPMFKQGFGVEAMAKKSEELRAADDDNFELVYDRLLEQLSAEGVDVVMEYVDKEITPKFIYKKIDYTSMAIANASIYLDNIERLCNEPFRGELIVTMEQKGKVKTMSKTIR